MKVWNSKTPLLQWQSIPHQGLTTLVVTFIPTISQIASIEAEEKAKIPEAEAEVQAYLQVSLINFTHKLKVLILEQKDQSVKYVERQVIQPLIATTGWIMPIKASIHLRS